MSSADSETLREISEFTKWDSKILEKIVKQPFSRLTNCEKIIPAPSKGLLGYVTGAGYLRLGEHWGQLKLLLSEIEFLVCIGDPQKGTKFSLVYAGAAPGVHIPLLMSLFAQKIGRWVLVDPARFSPGLAKAASARPSGDEVELVNALFTNELAHSIRARLRGEHLVFVSDIRRDETSEEMIAEDMAAQAEWADALRPHRSMFKFRLPYVANGYLAESERHMVRYPHGRVVSQAFATVSTTEARLITNVKSETREYDAAAHEEGMFVISLLLRSAGRYMHPICPWRRGEGVRMPVPSPDLWDWNYSYDTMRMFSILLELVREQPELVAGSFLASEKEDVLLLSPNLKDSECERLSAIPGFGANEWRAAAALSIVCMRTCGFPNLRAKRLSRPDGVLLDASRAARFRAKCRRDYMFAKEYFNDMEREL